MPICALKAQADPGNAPHLGDRIEWESKLLVRAPDRFRIRPLGEAVRLARSHVDVCAQIGVALLFASGFDLRIEFDEFGLADLLRPTALWIDRACR
jgi:hypothetical protein